MMQNPTTMSIAVPIPGARLMPIGIVNVPLLIIVGVVGTEMAVVGVVNSDMVAAWVGIATVVSAGVLTVVKNWREMWRRELIQDMTDRIRVLEENNRELEHLRQMERDQSVEAQKTFDLIRVRMTAEIDCLRATIREMDLRNNKQDQSS